MNLQALVDAMNEASSQERSNYHLTLGALAGILESQPNSTPVVFDFDVKLSPSSPESYRGYYCDLSLPPSETPITARELLLMAQEAIGSVFVGYKGGDFEMHAGTPLWASPYGSANGRAIMGAKVIGDHLVLLTKQID